MTIPLLSDVVIILGWSLGGGLQVVLTGVAAWARARILVRVLRRYLIPQVEIEEVVGDVRSRGYELFREMAMDRVVDPGELHQHIPDPKVATVKMGEASYLVGRTLQEVALRAGSGVTLLLVRRGERGLSNPGSELRFEPGGQLMGFGSLRAVADAAALARGTEPWEDP